MEFFKGVLHQGYFSIKVWLLKQTILGHTAAMLASVKKLASHSESLQVWQDTSIMMH